MDVKAIITEAATRYGIDPNIALGIAYIESKFDPQAQNPKSSAGGLFQFIDGTWAEYGGGQNRKDAYANADAGVRFIRDNAAILKRRLGREPTGGELYLAHQQGAGGAIKLLSQPTTRARDIVGDAAIRLNAGNDTMSAKDFAGLWTNKMDDALGKIGAPVNRVQGMEAPASMSNMANSEFSTDDDGKVSFSSVAPTLGVTDEERRAADAEAEQNKFGLLQGAKAAIGNEWSILTPFRALSGQDIDPDFRLTEENLTQYGAGVPNEYLGDFADAVSADHAEAIRERLLKQLEVNEKLGNMGWTGTALSMGAAVTDPAAIAAALAIGAASGGTGLAPAVAARLGRVGMVGLGATEGVLGNLAADIPLNAVDPTRGATELKWSIGTGLLMGGAFGALRTNPAFAQEAADLTRIGKELQTEALNERVPAISAHEDSVNAARVLDEVSYRSDTQQLDAIYSDMAKDTKAEFGRVRFDVTGQLLKSQNPMVRSIARYLGEDAVRAGDGQVTQIAATEVQSKLYRTSTYNWVKGYSKAWDGYRKANKIGFFQAAEELVKFKTQVSDLIRETDASRRLQYPKHVQEAAATFDAEMNSWWQKAGELGLPRSENGVAHYFPRYPDLTAASKNIDKFSYSRDAKNGGLASLYREAIIAKQPEIDPELAHKMGYAMVDRMTKLHAGENLMNTKLGSNDLDDLEDILGDYLSPDEYASVRSALEDKTPASERGPHGGARLKHRVLLDENFVGKIQNRYTGQLEEVSIKSFYISDPNLAMHLYARNMSGNVAMAGIQIKDPVTGELLIDGIKSHGDWNKLLEQVKGVGQKHSANTDKDLENLSYLHSAITGAPMAGVKENGDWATALRLLRDFNFSRLMGQVGLAQIPEIGRTAATVGLKTMYASMPSFRQLVKLAKTGDMGEELADELDAIGAFGTDYLRSRFHIELDDFGAPITHGADTPIQRLNTKAAPKLHAMNRFVGLYSGMAPINGLFQRWTSRAVAVKFARMALDGDVPNTARLRALGLDEGDFNSIMEEIKAHAKFKGGVRSGSKLEALGITEWDGNTAARFEAALYRASRSIILENDAGQFAKWMQHPLGKTMLQFRTFAVGSWTKATLQGLNMADTEAAMGFLASAFIGSLVYMGQTHLNLIGDPDHAEKAADRLGWAKLGMAAFQRTSESSLLPMAVDTVAELATGAPIFDFRSTGLASDMFFGNPTVDLINTAKEGVTGLATAAAGDDYSAPDFKNLTKTLPLQRLMGFTQLYNWMGSGLPRYEDRD